MPHQYLHCFREFFIHWGLDEDPQEGYFPQLRHRTGRINTLIRNSLLLFLRDVNTEKVSTARKLPLLFLTLRNLLTIPMAPAKGGNDHLTAEEQWSNILKQTKYRSFFRSRWMKKYWSLTLLEWLTKPISPLLFEDDENEPDDPSPPPTPLPRNLELESEPCSMLSPLIPDNNTYFPAPRSQLFTGTSLPQVEANQLSLLPAEEPVRHFPSHGLPNLVQRVRQSQLCIDPKDLVIPYTPITVYERLPGTDEVRTTVINTCGMTSLPYTLHDDDPFDSKYPNLTTLLPPVSTFFNPRRKRQS
uniref:Uncharacterized protein n=1 Tax=Setaria digitata TaxID=48799 RepID=A0A915PHG0_9BILA